MLKRRQEASQTREGTGDNGHVRKSDGLERGAGSAAWLSFAVRDESEAPLLFFHLFLSSFITFFLSLGTKLISPIYICSPCVSLCFISSRFISANIIQLSSVAPPSLHLRFPRVCVCVYMEAEPFAFAAFVFSQR